MASFKSDLKTGQYLSLGLLSFVTALFAYLLVFFVGYYASLYFASDFDIGASFDFGGITFDVERNSPLWTYDATVSIILARPLISLLIGVVALIAFTLIKKTLMVLHFLLLWINVFAFNFAFGLFITDFISHTGICFVAESMGVGIPIMIFLVVVSAFFMYYIGKINGLVYFNVLPQKYSAGFTEKVKTIIFTVFAPWLLVSFLMNLLSLYGNSFLGHLSIVPVIIVLIPFLFCKRSIVANSKNRQVDIKFFEWFIAVLFLMFSALLYINMLSPITITIAT